MVADSDDINVISYLINGGNNGLSERKKYLAELKKVPVFICDKNNIRSFSGDWHDPIDNPEITLYNYYGTYNPQGSSFGRVRNGGTKNHQGLDIFAPTGTPVKACLDGTVVTVNQNDGNWGKLIVIEVKKEDLDAARRNFIPYNIVEKLKKG